MHSGILLHCPAEGTFLVALHFMSEFFNKLWAGIGAEEGFRHG